MADREKTQQDMGRDEVPSVRMSNSKAKVLVVGGAGYVGSVLVRELLGRGYAVKVFDRLFFGDVGLAEVRDSIELVVGDVRAVDASLFEGVGTIINLSGLSNDPTAEYNPRANYEMNTMATERLAVEAKAQGISRFVFASSCSVYYVPAGVEMPDVLLDETAQLAPKAAYSYSKHEAEKRLLALSGTDFCPVILRMGTVFGFSPRMRYDLVVNTFVCHALRHGALDVHLGGEMWRPLVDVRDVARAYIAAVEAPEERVKGEIFNVATQNYRISELALRVREALREEGIVADIRPEYAYQGVRSYRVSTEKIRRLMGFTPTVTLEESICHMVENIRKYRYTNFDHPRYWNIQWMKLLEETHGIISVTGTIFGAPSGSP